MALDELILYSAKRAEDPTPPVQTVEQPRADPEVEATPTAPTLESPSARQPEEGSTAASGGLGENEQVALTTDGSAIVSKATARIVGSLGVEAGVASDAPESGTMKPVAPPEASQGMVGPIVRPQSAPVVPRTTVEEDKVEEIERA